MHSTPLLTAGAVAMWPYQDLLILQLNICSTHFTHSLPVIPPIHLCIYELGFVLFFFPFF